MLYTEFFNKSAGLTITQAENGLFYLEPLWKFILKDNQLNVSDVSDAEMDWAEILEMLKLEVERRNSICTNRPLVEDWLFDTISATVEPAIMQEETDYIKNVIEFMKTNHKLSKGDTDGDDKLGKIIPLPVKDKG